MLNWILILDDEYCSFCANPVCGISIVNQANELEKIFYKYKDWEKYFCSSPLIVQEIRFNKWEINNTDPT